MRRNPFMMAGALLLVVTVALSLWLRLRTPPEPPKVPMRDVVMAVQTIPPRTIIRPDMVHVQPVDPQTTPVSADVPRALTEVVDSVTVTEIQPGRPIRLDQIRKRTQFGLAGRLEPGQRAITIQVTEASGVAGLVRPGDRVDVLCTLPPEEGRLPRTIALVQGVSVVAVGKAMDPQPQGKGATQEQQPASSSLVTLAVTPAQARWIGSAQSRATLQLTLRPVAEGPDYVPERRTPERSPLVALQTPSRRRPAIRREPPRAARRPFRPAPSLGLTPMDLRPLHDGLVMPPIPPWTTRRPSPSAPAARQAAPAPRTVEVIRGTQSDTVTLGGVPAESGAPAPASPGK